jgi:uncharacterized protein YjbI with pentapeptide repeats
MFISRLRDWGRILRISDIADVIAFSIRRLFRLIEILALPTLLLATLTLVIVAVSRALAWSSMTHLVTNPKDRIQSETQIFVTLGQILGGGFILTGLYFTGKSYVLARRGQFAERLGVAIEGLGDNALQRRLGSIISLGAMINDERGNVSVIATVLCSFIRTATKDTDYQAAYCNSEPRADVQAAISALAQARKRTAWWRWVEIDLRSSTLSHTNFDTGDFRRALFQDCVLEGSSFFRCRLARANFSRARIDKSNFNQADLRGSVFFQSTSTSSTFRRANFVKANLSRAKLADCAFDGARLIDCTFAQSDLEGSTFRGSHIRRGEYHKVDAKVIDAMNIQ